MTEPTVREPIIQADRQVPSKCHLVEIKERTVTIPDTMQALVQTESGYAGELPTSSEIDSLDPYLRYETISTPTPTKGQVLIEVTMSPINPSDVTFVAGVYSQPRVAGAPAGFESAGDVVASGGGIIADPLVGRRVSFFAGVSGTWAEYAMADAKTCIPLRSEVKNEDGAALLVNPFSAWAMHDIVRQSGRTSFVMTAAASQLCRHLTVLAAKNGQRSISLVRRDEHIAPLTDLGATHVLNTERPEFTDALKAVLGERIEGFWLTSWLAKGSLCSHRGSSTETRPSIRSGPRRGVATSATGSIETDDPWSRRTGSGRCGRDRGSHTRRCRRRGAVGALPDRVVSAV